MLASADMTRLLATLGDGDRTIAAELLPLIYDELRSMAGRLLERRSPGHTLQPTALVHEAYLRFHGQGQPKWENRAHFFRVAAIAMRQILTNHARDKARQKRGGEARRVPLDDAIALFEDGTGDFVQLDEHLTRLASFDSRSAQVVELRFFAGLSVAEVAEVLGVSERTVKMDWHAARLWLLREIEAGAST